mmetsp:Transcript_8573/g.18083  ORF Transcript_8573/g.18083 Transcript_8573/m.18083 type:complete len:443 (+) Transcript_8573:238-1566(+)
MTMDTVSPLPSDVAMSTPTKNDSETVTLSSEDTGTASSTPMPAAQPATPSPAPAVPAPADRDGYIEEAASIELRKDRTVYNRIVTITPPKPEPWWSPTPKKKKKQQQQQRETETNSPNPFLSPFKDMIDRFSQHGENVKKEKARTDAEAKEEARKRVERVTGQVSDVAAELCFVHGGCASSSQFDQLLGSLWERINDPETKPSNLAGGRIRCHLYDAVGCGSSAHDPSDWDAYNSDEQMKDLEEIVRSVAGSSTSSTPIYLIGHSYGSSQIIRLLPLLPESISARIEGLILISGALANGPSDVPNDNGPCVFCFPVWFLKLLQPKMNDAFLSNAYHPTTDEGLVLHGRAVCEGNDMGMVKAFYRQWTWATADDAAKVVKVPTVVVVHGAEDRLIVPAAGEHLHDMIPDSEYRVVDDAGHQVMEERPADVAEIIMGVVSKKKK